MSKKTALQYHLRFKLDHAYLKTEDGAVSTDVSSSSITLQNKFPGLMFDHEIPFDLGSLAIREFHTALMFSEAVRCIGVMLLRSKLTSPQRNKLILLAELIAQDAQERGHLHNARKATTYIFDNLYSLKHERNRVFIRAGRLIRLCLKQQQLAIAYQAATDLAEHTAPQSKGRLAALHALLVIMDAAINFQDSQSKTPWFYPMLSRAAAYQCAKHAKYYPEIRDKAHNFLLGLLDYSVQYADWANDIRKAIIMSSGRNSEVRAKLNSKLQASTPHRYP